MGIVVILVDQSFHFDDIIFLVYTDAKLFQIYFRDRKLIGFLELLLLRNDYGRTFSFLISILALEYLVHSTCHFMLDYLVSYCIYIIISIGSKNKVTFPQDLFLWRLFLLFIWPSLTHTLIKCVDNLVLLGWCKNVWVFLLKLFIFIYYINWSNNIQLFVFRINSLRDQFIISAFAFGKTFSLVTGIALAASSRSRVAQYWPLGFYDLLHPASGRITSVALQSARFMLGIITIAHQLQNFIHWLLLLIHMQWLYRVHKSSAVISFIWVADSKTLALRMTLFLIIEIIFLFCIRINNKLSFTLFATIYNFHSSLRGFVSHSKPVLKGIVCHWLL